MSAAASVTADDDNFLIRVQLNEENLSLRNRLRKCVFIVEPTVLLLFFSMNLSSAIFQNQVLYQTCSTVYGYNQTDCLRLGTSEATKETEEIETQIQPYAANIFMARLLIESIIPALGSLFIGPWSDKFGRKPVILSAFIGYCSIYLLSSVIAFLSTKYLINPWFYIITIIPVSLIGGSCSLITGVSCYIADTTTMKDRPFRMAVLEAAIYIGLMIGSLSSSYILQATNSTTVFLISTGTMLFVIFYTIFFIDESVPTEKLEKSSKIRGLFRWELVKDMIKTCFEKRTNYDRLIIWLTMLSLGIGVFEMEGSSTVFFLYVREKFQWTVKDYTIYDSGSILIQILGNIIGMYLLQKILGLSITSLALLAYGSSVIDSVIKAAALYPWHLYLAIGLTFLQGISSPMCRSILSNVVPASDIGKVFSLTTSIEAISPLGSAPLYTYVYSSTLKTYPGAFNIISASMWFICYILLAIIFGIQKCFPNTTYEAIS